MAHAHDWGEWSDFGEPYTEFDDDGVGHTYQTQVQQCTICDALNYRTVEL